MNIQLLEKILKLFDKCQVQEKPLQLNIEQDILKILPFPKTFLLQLLSEPIATSISYLSNDQNTFSFRNNLSLCEYDQIRSGSCQLSSCRQLHICKDYIFYERCSHPHTLSDNHNRRILERFDLSPEDEFIREFLSHIIKFSSQHKSNSLIVQTRNGGNISDQLIDKWLGEHKSLLIKRKLINSSTVQLIFDDHEVASMMEDLINQHYSSTVSIKKHNAIENQEKDLDREVERTNEQTSNRYDQTFKLTAGRGRGKQQYNNPPPLTNQSPQSSTNTFSRRLAPNDQPQTTEKKFSLSQRFQNEYYPSPTKTKSSDGSSNSTPETTFSSNHTNSSLRSSIPKTDVPNNYNSSPPHNVSDENIPFQSYPRDSKPHFVLRGHQTKPKEKSPVWTNYNYTKPFRNDHLCYLLGPAKEQIENDQHEILYCLPSGFCRVTNNQQGRDIEKRLYLLIPEKLNRDVVKIHEDLLLLINSSAAEWIFQQSQTQYAIFSESTKVPLNIEIINPPNNDRRRSSASSFNRENSSQSVSNGKFHINTTDSTIDVISGDISQIPVDMMICISTSNNLRESVLRCAGDQIEQDYHERYSPSDALLLDGGLTKARKILFVPWQTEIEGTETNATQKSLSDLVKWCIEQAQKRKLKSISFPPIGAGQLGLDPAFVCEAMVGAASESLHQYKIDVIFVIYPSTDNSDDECYQVFRIYLDSLRQQIQSPRVSISITTNERNMSKNTEMKTELVRRDVISKRVSTLSNLTNMPQHHNLLTKSLEKIMHEKTFDLSLITSRIRREPVDVLIDICLKHNIYPRIDYSREEIIFRGDAQSISQCFYNICGRKEVFDYSYVLTENGEKSDQINFNSFISLKIDEAFAMEESNISIEDENKMTYHIDLRKLQVQINKKKESTFLVKKQLNKHNQIQPPSSWSDSVLFIRLNPINSSSYQRLECFRAFQETMSMRDWEIERIDAIENYPLYIHFMEKNEKERTKLYFHGCSYSSVQSIVYYGLHSSNVSNYGRLFENSSMGSICLTRDVLNSHLYGTRQSTDGKHYLFAVELAKIDNNNDFILLSNKDAYLALPTHLIVYQRRNYVH